MITSITMKGVATYDSSGVVIDTNRRINFFFGYNGSGKSTIAKYLRDIALPVAEKSPDFYSCNHVGFNPSSESILVYNEDFKSENFITKDEQRGIFSLNKTNSKIDGLINEANIRVAELQRCLSGSKIRETELNTKVERKLKDLEDLVFSKRSLFASCRNAIIPYGGSKKSFLTHIRSFLNHSEPSKQLPELLQEYNRVFLNGLNYIPYSIDIDALKELVEQETHISDLLSEVIVGNKDVDIAELIDSLQMSSWVEEGIPIMKRAGGVCPFCQRPFDDKDALQLKFELYFDKTYKEKIESLRDKSSAYLEGLGVLLRVLNEIVKVFNPNNQVSTLIGEFQTLKDGFVQTINDKNDRPNEKKSLQSLAPYQERLTEINDLINTNNNDFKNLSVLQKQWLRDAQIYISEESRSAIEKYDQWKGRCDHVLASNLFTQKTLLEHIAFQVGLIDGYRKQTINTTDAVNNIKKILKNVGFDGFEIQEKKIPGTTTPTYCLKRSSSGTANVYKSLSEGEKTFISFLYFHQLCLGTDDLSLSSKKKIVVIDDPVSSLDSKVMFVITTLIHQLARYKGRETKPDRQTFLNPNIEQIFVFTHNFYFYKEVSLDRRPINKSIAHHIIEKNNSVSTVSCTGDHCTIKNDYSMMWDALKRIKKSIGSDKTQNVMIANTMRRVIDTYIDFIGAKKDKETTITWSSIDSFEEGTPEFIVESAFISLINDESHGLTAMDDMYYDSIIRQEPAVIFKAFQVLFKAIGRSHYEYMMDEDIPD